MKKDLQKKLNDNVLPWLLVSNPWVRYRTLIDLLEKNQADPEVKKARIEMLAHSKVRNLITETSDWMSLAPSRYNDSKISYFKLKILTDFGLDKNDNGMKKIIDKARVHLEEGLFTVRGARPERPKNRERMPRPDPQTREWHAFPCNNPVITYCLYKLGITDSSVWYNIEKLCSFWQTEQGWFCHFFFVENIYKKIQVGCPMAGLTALELFTLLPDKMRKKYINNAFAPLKYHWESRQALYFFGRSKKFWTLKYPFVWYNALYLAEVLTQFPFLKNEELVKELITWLEGLSDTKGFFTPDSIFMNYREWDFGNKKEPSSWITFLCYRILKRWYNY